MQVVPQSGALGAEIRGVDLSRPVDPEVAAAVREAFLEHQVIFFADQDLAPGQLRDFASEFGTPSDYPFAEGLPQCPQVTEIVKEPEETVNFGGEWHSDTTYLEMPPQVTALYAKQVPQAGGDTVFASMYLAFEQLSPGLRAMLSRLRAVNTAGLLGREKRDGYATMQSRNIDRLDTCAEHPVVRTHPETGRKALYINPTHTLHFVDMTREESLPLIEYLARQAARPEICFRLRWKRGMLTLWDNRCAQHYAVNDYHGQRRVMQRVTVTGERPA